MCLWRKHWKCQLCSCTQATALIFDPRTIDILKKVSEFLDKIASTLGGLEFPTLAFMSNALPFELPGSDNPQPMFWNTGSGGIDTSFCKVIIRYVNRAQATSLIFDSKTLCIYIFMCTCVCACVRACVRVYFCVIIYVRNSHGSSPSVYNVGAAMNRTISSSFQEHDITTTNTSL